MTHLQVHEWKAVAVATPGDGGAGFTRAQANALIAAARAHPLGGGDGTGIVTDHYTHLRAGQMVGVLAAAGCSLEILPKVDPAAPDEDAATVRQRLLRMLTVTLGLAVGAGEAAAMARQDESLLDTLIRVFAEGLLVQTRRGLPRAYLPHEDDLPALRGRLDVVRQFTVHAVRPDRLACRYDALSSDIPLLQAMKAAVLFAGRHVRSARTRRLIDDLRLVLADIADIPPRDLAWHSIHIDRTNRRWEGLLQLARLFLRRQWQDARRHDAPAGRAPDGGLALLFAMNDLFEGYVAALLARGLRTGPLADLGLSVDAQAGGQYCLADGTGERFQTRPDLIVRDAGGRPRLIIDTKWKALAASIDDPRRGVSQADVYQMMAYAQLYACPQVMLLYPHHAGLGHAPLRREFTILPDGQRHLHLASIDLAAPECDVIDALQTLIASATPELN